MKYNYSELSSKQFEELVISICYELFGMSTQSFTDGPDGGRDARYEGTANLYPSKASPWEGVTIIQAKHTIGYNEKFSDPSFFSESSQSSQIILESIKIKNLVDNGLLNNYILFSNRKLTANANEKILSYLAAYTGLEKQKISLVGVETIENLLKKYRDIPSSIGLNPFDMPLNIEPDELAEIITAIKDALPEIRERDITPNLQRTDFEDKNVLNKLNQDYAELIKRRLSDFYEIEEFLSMPENEKFQEMYQVTAEEIHAKLTIYKISEHSFATILEKIIELLIQRDIDCRKNKILTRLMVFYMYYRCDIGEKHVASA